MAAVVGKVNPGAGEGFAAQPEGADAGEELGETAQAGGDEAVERILRRYQEAMEADDL